MASERVVWIHEDESGIPLQPELRAERIGHRVVRYVPEEDSRQVTPEASVTSRGDSGHPSGSFIQDARPINEVSASAGAAEQPPAEPVSGGPERVSHEGARSWVDRMGNPADVRARSMLLSYIEQSEHELTDLRAKLTKADENLSALSKRHDAQVQVATEERDELRGKLTASEREVAALKQLLTAIDGLVRELLKGAGK